MCFAIANLDGIAQCSRSFVRKRIRYRLPYYALNLRGVITPSSRQRAITSTYRRVVCESGNDILLTVPKIPFELFPKHLRYFLTISLLAFLLISNLSNSNKQHAQKPVHEPLDRCALLKTRYTYPIVEHMFDILKQTRSANIAKQEKELIRSG